MWGCTNERLHIRPIMIYSLLCAANLFLFLTLTLLLRMSWRTSLDCLMVTVERTRQGACMWHTVTKWVVRLAPVHGSLLANPLPLLH